jgi:hypothetical protein
MIGSRGEPRRSAILFQKIQKPEQSGMLFKKGIQVRWRQPKTDGPLYDGFANPSSLTPGSTDLQIRRTE